MSKRRPRSERVSITCGSCGQPAHNAYICTGCADQLHGDLASIAELIPQLHIELTRRAVKGRSHGHSRRVDAPLPYDPDASEALSTLRSELVTAARAVAVEDSQLPDDDLSAIVEWLRIHEVSIGLRPEAGDICRGLDRVCRSGWRLVDTRPERIYIGTCPCGTTERPSDLYAARGATTTHCRNCDKAYGVAESIEAREEDARETWVTAREVAALTRGRVSAKRVDKWVERGRLHRSEGGYVRFGDVLNLEAKWEAKRGEKVA